MTWNNRIFKHKYIPKPGEKPAGVFEYYQIHETYYDENGGIGFSGNPVTPYGENVDELIAHLKKLLNDVERSKDDVLEYEEKK